MKENREEERKKKKEGEKERRKARKKEKERGSAISIQFFIIQALGLEMLRTFVLSPPPQKKIGWVVKCMISITQIPKKRHFQRSAPIGTK